MDVKNAKEAGDLICSFIRERGIQYERRYSTVLKDKYKVKLYNMRMSDMEEICCILDVFGIENKIWKAHEHVRFAIYTDSLVFYLKEK